MNTSIRLALDWIPNMLHAGLLYAHVKGWFQEAYIALEFLSPEADDYGITNEMKLLSGDAHIAIVPAELIFESNELRKEKIVPFANILQKNTSGIFTLKSSGINRPAELAGMRYGAIEIPYEVNLIRSIIKADGTDSSPFVVCPNRLSVWNELLAGKIDAAWAFSVIEGVEAEHKGVDVNIFKFEDFGIPYPAVPFFAVTQRWKKNNIQVLGAFNHIMMRGYQACYENPELVAKVLTNANLHSYTNDYEFNLKCLLAMKPLLLDENNQWGAVDFKKLDHFRSWLIYQNLIGYESEAITINDLF